MAHTSDLGALHKEGPLAAPLVSVVILTLNEELNLPGALASLHGLCEDVVVFDSFSVDKTCDIARQFGARVEQRRFDGYASQRNAALGLQFRTPWVMMIDADERVTPELWAELCDRCVDAPESVSLFRLRRKDYFFGKWIRRSGGYPTWFGRVVRVGKVRVEREINEQYVADGSVGYLAEHLVHFPFNRGASHWIDRHNQYSTMEAAQVVEQIAAPLSLRDVVSADPVTRRAALKRLALRLPFRPQLVFAYLYLVRGGFLEGRAGYWYCKLRAAYEFFIDLKVAELRAGAAAKHDASGAAK